MRGVGSALVVASAVTASCGSGGDTAPGTFTVDFPTTAAAIAVLRQTPGVQVLAFSTSANDAGVYSCDTLVEQSRNDVLPAPLASSAVLTPCQLMSGMGSVAVGYGSYAFLAVAQTSPGTDYMVGCAEQTISATNTVVTIPLTLAGPTDAVPTTTCTSLSQACSGSSC